MSQLSVTPLSADQIEELRDKLYFVATIAEALDDLQFARGQDYRLKDNSSSATKIFAPLPINEVAASAWIDLKRVLVDVATFIGKNKTRTYIWVDKATGKNRLKDADGEYLVSYVPIGVNCGGSPEALADFILEHLVWLANNVDAEKNYVKLTEGLLAAAQVARLAKTERAEVEIPDNVSELATAHGEVPARARQICEVMNKRGMFVKDYHLRDWVEAKKLSVHSYDAVGKPLYLPSTVINVYNLQKEFLKSKNKVA